MNLNIIDIPDAPERDGKDFDDAVKERLTTAHPVKLSVFTFQQLEALTPRLFEGYIVRCSNGYNGAECLSYCDGFVWRMVDLGLNIAYSGSKAQLLWTKKAANSITLTEGSSGEALSDLQTAFDGNVYHITEAAATPGVDLIIDYINIESFSFVEALLNYNGSATHSLSLQLYNWLTAAWNTFNTCVGIEITIVNHSFWVPSDVNYIGTEANLGKVRVRVNHTMAGNASHDVYIDSVALYK